MIPQRFVTEYPERCLQLFDILEPQATANNLVGSFALLAASAAFVIPYERLKKHPLETSSVQTPSVSNALRHLEKQPFASADFWRGSDPGYWRFTRVMEHVDDTQRWRDPDKRHPMSKEAVNKLEGRKAGEVLRVIRNALAHGNIVFLDGNGFETRGAPAQFLAFLSRYEENEEQRSKAETYRLIVASERDFLNLVKAWVKWIATFPRDTSLSDAA